MDSKRFIVVMVLIVGAAIGFFMFGNAGKEGASSSVNSKGSSNYYGKLDSPVTLTEFVDFQCEACYAYYPHVKEVKEKYKDKVRFQVRNFPITSGHQFAMMAAKSAEAAARQGKFWEMHDRLYEGQKQWERISEPQIVYDQYAKEIGLDMTKFETDRKSNSVNAVIQKDLQDVQKLGGSGTPTFVLNGKLIDSPKPSVDELSKVLDDALKASESQ